MLFDSHAHYDSEKFNDDRDEIIESLHNKGISYIINAASNIDSSYKSIELANKYDYIYAAVGIHPHDTASAPEDAENTIYELAKNKKVIAIGEIGLDYHYDFSPRETQKKWFSKQINIAKNLHLPIIIHNRESHEDTLQIIKEENAKSVGGVFHCFSGSVEMAKLVLKNNMYISFAGPITFKNAKRIIEVAQFVPIEYILIETDSPYLAPTPHRGKRNDSSYITYIAQTISQIKNMDYDEVCNITCNNAKKLFNIQT